MLFGSIVIVLSGKIIVGIALGEKYTEYHPVLMVSWIACGLLFISRVFELKQRTIRKLRIELVGNIGGVLVMLTASYPIIIYFNLYGVAWMYVFCAAAMMFALLIAANTNIPFLNRTYIFRNEDR